MDMLATQVVRVLAVELEIQTGAPGPEHLDRALMGAPVIAQAILRVVAPVVAVALEKLVRQR